MGKIKETKLIILILVLIDQITKIVVNSFFKEKSFRLLYGKLGFEVYLNKYYMSIFNSNLGLNLSTLILTFINLIILIFLVSFYLYIIKTNSLNKVLRLSLILIISANICSIIDKVFWGGSLDFIVFFGYIIDIKDILLYLGVLSFGIIYIYKYEIRKIDMKDVENLKFKNYLKYIKSIFVC